jgi:hypothetical protein
LKSGAKLFWRSTTQGGAMAKKKSDRTETVQMSLYDEEIAYFLTLLLKEVSPSINEAATYELVAAMLSEGTEDEVAHYYGGLIRSTSFQDKAGKEKH